MILLVCPIINRRSDLRIWTEEATIESVESHSSVRPRKKAKDNRSKARRNQDSINYRNLLNIQTENIALTEIIPNAVNTGPFPTKLIP